MSQRSAENEKTFGYSNKDQYISNTIYNKNTDTKCEIRQRKSKANSNKTNFSVFCEEKIEELFLKSQNIVDRFEKMFEANMKNLDHFSALRKTDGDLSDEEHQILTSTAQVLLIRYKYLKEEGKSDTEIRSSLKGFEESLLDQILFLPKPEDETETNFPFLIRRELIIDDFEDLIVTKRNIDEKLPNETNKMDDSLI